MRAFMSSRASSVLISPLSASSTGCGAPPGRNTPNHEETSNLASSGALSRMVGMSGESGLRSGIVVARPTSLPARICGSDGNRLSNRICTCPPSAAVSAGPAPRNGTWIIFSPVSCRNHAAVRCGLCPVPEVAKLTESGFFFRYAINSGIDFTGTEGCADTILVVRIMLLTGCN